MIHILRIIGVFLALFGVLTKLQASDTHDVAKKNHAPVKHYEIDSTDAFAPVKAHEKAELDKKTNPHANVVAEPDPVAKKKTAKALNAKALPRKQKTLAKESIPGSLRFAPQQVKGELKSPRQAFSLDRLPSESAEADLDLNFYQSSE